MTTGGALAPTFFAGINIGADTTVQAALKQQVKCQSASLLVFDSFPIPVFE